MRLELERGGDPEVATAAAQAPEQFRIVVVADLEHLALGGDELDRRQVVDGHAEAAHQPPDPAAERQARDAGRRDHTAGRRQPVLVRRPVVVVPRRTALHPRPPPDRVDVAAPHRREIDHHAALGDRLAGDVVPATADRDLQIPRRARSARRRRRRRCCAPRDQRRSLVDQPVVNGPSRVVAGILAPTTSPENCARSPSTASPDSETHDPSSSASGPARARITNIRQRPSSGWKDIWVSIPEALCARP